MLRPPPDEEPVGSGVAAPHRLRHADLRDGRIDQTVFPLVDPVLRSPFREDGLWLVRPDGYVACAAAADDEGVIARYLAEHFLRKNQLASP